MSAEHVDIHEDVISVIQLPYTESIVDSIDNTLITCNHCNAAIDVLDEAVQCQDCCKWVEFRCTSLNDSDRDQYRTNKDRFWVCDICNNDLINACPELPSFIPCKPLDNVVWGKLKGDSILDELNLAHNEIVKWKANLFLTPSGQIGKSFIFF